MSMFDSPRDQIIHMFATDRMWAETSGDADSPTGFFGALSVDSRETAAAMVAEWLTIAGELPTPYPESNPYGEAVISADDPESFDVLIGHWLAEGDLMGNHFVTAHESAEDLARAYASMEAEYSEWLGDDED